MTSERYDALRNKAENEWSKSAAAELAQMHLTGEGAKMDFAEVKRWREQAGDSPSAAQDFVNMHIMSTFLPSYQRLLLRHDTNSDGQIDKEEWSNFYYDIIRSKKGDKYAKELVYAGDAVS